MSTFLFDKTIFGPVKSRRLGNSLGVNLLPNDQKVCNFNCIYCECGWNPEKPSKMKLPSKEEVLKLLDNELNEMLFNGKPLDTITFAGNGEPTMHPQFAEIIDGTIELRNKYFPGINIAVLSNSTLTFKESIFNALQKIELNILKIDSALENTCKLLNNPTGHFNIKEIIENLKKFKGKLIIQTMFVKGTYNGVAFNNTSELELNAWLLVIKEIKPIQVMIYTIARDTPLEDIYKIPYAELKSIAERVENIGIIASISD